MVKRSKVTKTRRFIFCSCFLPSLVGSIWRAVIWNIAFHQGRGRKSMAEQKGSLTPSKRTLPPIFYCQSTSHNHTKYLRGSSSTCARGKRARNSCWIAQMTIVPFIEPLPFIECLLYSLTTDKYLTPFYLILKAILEGVTIVFTLKMRTLRFREISKCPRSQLVARLGSGVCGTPAPASLHSVHSIFVIHYHLCWFRCTWWSITHLPLYFSFCWEGSHQDELGARMQKPCSSILSDGECQKSLTSVLLQIKWFFFPSRARWTHLHACRVCVHGGST